MRTGRVRLLLLTVFLGGLLVAVGIFWHTLDKVKSSKINRDVLADPMDDLVIARDIVYREGNRNGLDIYVQRAPSLPRQVVVFFYGGGWDSGAKADFAWVGAALARNGYLAIIPDYRLYPEVVWPEFLKDCAAAVRWAHDRAGDYNGDSSAIVVMGHSAGAYNAISLAVDRRWLGAVGIDPRRDLRAAIGLAGPYDFLPLERRRLKAIFGVEKQLQDTQPINHVNGDAPPLLLLTGDRDQTIDPPETDRMAAKIRAAGGAVFVIHYPLLDHGGILNALAERNSDVIDNISKFIANARR